MKRNIIVVIQREAKDLRRLESKYKATILVLNVSYYDAFRIVHSDTKRMALWGE